MAGKALIVDDSSTIRAIVADALRDVGATHVTEAHDGQQALDLFDENEFDLIVLDWCMPGMSGLDLLKTIRQRGSDVPVLMVTAIGTQREQVIEAVQAGVSDYLLKPFDGQTLRAKLLKLSDHVMPTH